MAQEEQFYYDTEGKPFADDKLNIPLNWSYLHNNINHVANHTEFDSKEDFENSVRDKYRKVASGETKPIPTTGPDHDLKASYRKELEERDKKESGLEAKISELQGQVSEKEKMEAQIKDLEKLLDEATAPPEVRKVGPETPASVGPGKCPDCEKEFQRLDMHVCKGKEE